MLAGPFTVLTADDNEVHSYALPRILESRHYRVAAASCGSEALLIAKQEVPTLILLDVRLPDTNGYELCRKLKSFPETKRIPILIYSSCEIGGSYESKMSGATGFLTYPVDSSDLFAVIDGTLARADS